MDFSFLFFQRLTITQVELIRTVNSKTWRKCFGFSFPDCWNSNKFYVLLVFIPINSVKLLIFFWSFQHFCSRYTLNYPTKKLRVEWFVSLVPVSFISDVWHSSEFALEENVTRVRTRWDALRDLVSFV